MALFLKDKKIHITHLLKNFCTETDNLSLQTVFYGWENFTWVRINLASSVHVLIILFTSYSRLIKSSLVRLNSALVTASEFTGKSILPDIKTQKWYETSFTQYYNFKTWKTAQDWANIAGRTSIRYWTSRLERVKIADSHPQLLKEPHMKVIVILMPYCLTKETRSVHKYCAMETRQLVVNTKEKRLFNGTSTLWHQRLT